MASTVNPAAAAVAGAAAPAEESLLRLGTVIARLARGFRAVSADHGLTPSQLSVLATVVRHGPIGAGDIAEREGLNPTLASRVIGTLEEAGLVRRDASAKDRRCVVVTSTPPGRRMQARVRRQRADVLAGRLGGLEPDAVATVLAALPALERLAGLPDTEPGREGPRA